LLAVIGGGLTLRSSEPFVDSTRNLADTLVSQADAFVSNVTTVLTTIVDNVPENGSSDVSGLRSAQV